MNSVKSFAVKCPEILLCVILVILTLVNGVNFTAKAESIPFDISVQSFDENPFNDIYSEFDIGRINENNAKPDDAPKDTIIEMANVKTLYRNSVQISSESPVGSLNSQVLCEDVSVDVPFLVKNYEAGVTLSYDDLRLLYYVVDREVVSGSVEHKMIITQVILNRVKSPRFPNEVKDVLLSPNQFSPAYGYFDNLGFVPSDKTVRAVQNVLSGKSTDLSRGALYFCNPDIASCTDWFNSSLEYLFSMEGHSFYR